MPFIVAVDPSGSDFSIQEMMSGITVGALWHSMSGTAKVCTSQPRIRWHLFLLSAYANVVLELLSRSFIAQKSADNLSTIVSTSSAKSALQHGSEGIVSGTDIYFGRQWTDNSSDVRWVRYCGSIALAKPPLQ